MSEVRYSDRYNYILFTVFLFCMCLGVQKFVSEYLFKFFECYFSLSLQIYIYIYIYIFIYVYILWLTMCSYHKANEKH